MQFPSSPARRIGAQRAAGIVPDQHSRRDQGARVGDAAAFDSTRAVAAVSILDDDPGHLDDRPGLNIEHPIRGVPIDDRHAIADDAHLIHEVQVPGRVVILFPACQR
jgi:hypothetical protein